MLTRRKSVRQQREESFTADVKGTVSFVAFEETRRDKNVSRQWCLFERAQLVDYCISS